MSNNNKKYDYSFKVLHENVSDKDLFEENTHENVANTLHKLINSNDKAFAIGLEGAWGSGKSTVVNLLRNALNKNAGKEGQTLFFIFDAWAHEGDPLRRIFLESLIDEMKVNENSANKLEKLKEDISGKKRTVEVESHKNTSRLAKIISVASLFIPIGTALMLGGMNLNGLTINWEGNFDNANWLFLVGLCISLSPIWVLIYWCFCGDKKDNGDINFEVFESDCKETYTQDITEDGERTSIEFEGYFSKIMDAYIGKDKAYKQAVIVVDNLDRVSPDQAKAIWSTLQTFFQQRSVSDNNAAPWADKLWFLIPYDRDGFIKIWCEDDKVENENKNNDVTGDLVKGGVAESFIEKCFQLVIQVPTPIMSNWAAYLRKRIEESLLGWPESERLDVIDTFQNLNADLNSSPTPRQIQGFINQVGILGMQWQGLMSANAISAYSLLKQGRSESELRKYLLRNNSIMNGKAMLDMDADMFMELSGILFGVNKEKGAELLLEPEIECYFRGGIKKLGLLN